MGVGVLQFLPFLFILVFYGFVIAAVVWLFRMIKRMADTQDRIAGHLEAIARGVTKSDTPH